MINLQRLFDSDNPWTLSDKIRNFKNSKLDLSRIQNQMFQQVLKKYIFI